MTMEDESKKMVQVDPSVLEKLSQRLEFLEKRNEILQEAVGKNQLEAAENKKAPKGAKRAYLKKYNGKVVIGWRSSKENRIITNPSTNVPVGEVLQTILIYLDGSESGVIDQVLFTRTEDRETVELVKEEGEYWYVKFVNQAVSTDVLKVHVAFLNP